MKNTSRILLIIVIVFAILTASVPQLALAKPDSTGETSNPLIAGGSWTSGKYVDVTALASSAPNWLQLLTDGVKVTEAGKICHPFRGGQFGWIGEIRQYKNGQWVKLATTNDWVPNKEGQFMACAQAPAAGTYALFGWFDKPPKSAVVEVPSIEEPSFDCNTIEWDEVLATDDGPILIRGYLYNGGSTIYFTVTDYSPTTTVPPLSGSGTIDSDNFFNINTGIESGDYLSVTFSLYESSHNCSYTESVTYTSNPN